MDANHWRQIAIQRDTRFALVQELAYMHACELQSPNSPDFDALCEHLFNTKWEVWDHFFHRREEGYPVHEAKLKAGLADPTDSGE